MNKIEYYLSNIFLKIIYFFFYWIPINKKKIVFASPRSNKLEGNLKYIYNEIIRQKLDYKCIFLFDKYNYSLFFKVKYLISLIKGVYHLATAKYFIIDNSYYPVHILKHKKSTVVIQTWHACGAFKKFGYSTRDLKDGISPIESNFIHKNYDIAISSSKNVDNYYAEAFNMSKNNIKAIGVPRTDYFFNRYEMSKDRKNLEKKFQSFKGKKILLFAPTFRGRSKNKHITFNLDDKLMEKELSKDYILIIKSHPSIKISYSIPKEMQNFIFDLSHIDINKLFTITDILITDYSSTIFEFSLLNKPIIFYAYDLEAYEKNSKFYQNYYDFVPGPIINNTQELIKNIKEENFDFDLINEFANKHFDYFDGKSSYRFVNEILQNN